MLASVVPSAGYIVGSPGDVAGGPGGRGDTVVDRPAAESVDDH